MGRFDDRSNEYLFDVQAPTISLSGAEERIIALVGKLMAGGVVMCYTISELAYEIRRIRTRGAQR